MWDRCVSQRGMAPKNSTMINKAHNSRRGGGPSSLLYIDKLETPPSLHSSSRAVAPTDPATGKIFCSFDCQTNPHHQHWHYAAFRRQFYRNRYPMRPRRSCDLTTIYGNRFWRRRPGLNKLTWRQYRVERSERPGRAVNE